MKNALLILFAATLLMNCNKTNTTNCCSGGHFAAVDSSYIGLPDIFTPNADGINDLLYVRTRNITSFSITISKSSRTVVFSSTNITSGWDGTYNGKPCKEKDYSFVVQVTSTSGVAYNITGNICIIRDNCTKTPIVSCVFDSQFNGFYFDTNLPSFENIKVCN